MKTNIIDITNSNSYRIIPDFIYNRYDLFTNNYKVFRCKYNNNNYDIGVYLKGNIVEFGLWMADVPSCVIDDLILYVFDDYKNINKITFNFCKTKLNKYQYYICNHFNIKLPESVEDKNAALTKKARYNLKREKRIIEEELGIYTINEYKKNEIPNELMDRYFELKKVTHDIDYQMSGPEYLDQYHVTNAYSMIINNEIVGIMLSCEQCEAVYLENLTYDTKYNKYSIGKVFYDIYLDALINKGIKELYLGGGDYEYKRRYNSSESVVYDYVIFRNSLKNKSLYYYSNVFYMAMHFYHRIKGIKD